MQYSELHMNVEEKPNDILSLQTISMKHGTHSLGDYFTCDIYINLSIYVVITNRFL